MDRAKYDQDMNVNMTVLRFIALPDPYLCSLNICCYDQLSPKTVAAKILTMSHYPPTPHTYSPSTPLYRLYLPRQIPTDK
jgi:hypothetical protein